MKVRIVKALESRWYHSQIGSILNVGNPIGNAFSFSPDGYTSFYIDKSDCEILPEENQPEPFDLERALKGEEFTSKDGFARFRIISKSSLHDELYIFETVRNGSPNVEMTQLSFFNSSDYFMAPKPSEYVTKWVNVYKSESNYMFAGTFNNSEKEAKKCCDVDTGVKLLDTIPITFKRPS